jgi:hypothetical protein
MAHGYQMIYIRPSCSHHGHLSVCPTVVSKLCPGLEENGVKRVVERRRQLKVDIICQLNASEGVKREGRYWAPYWQPHFWLALGFGWEVMSHIPNSSNLVPSDFHLVELIKKQLAGKWFAADAYVMLDLTSWLHILHIDLFYTIIQGLVPYRDKWFNVWHSDVSIHHCVNRIE